MTTADIIILVIVLLIVGGIIARIIVKTINKDYCSDCSSKAGCALKIEDILKDMEIEIKK